MHGQKGFNGVALLSKLPFDEVQPGLAGDPDDVQARYLEAVVSVPSGVLRLVNIYLPNGNPYGTEKFAYKLAWLQALQTFLATAYTPEDVVLLSGDFNIAPEARDVYDATQAEGQILFHPDERAAFARLLAWGLRDTLRLHR